MKKSLSAPCLTSLAAPAPPTPHLISSLVAPSSRRNSVSCNSLATIIGDFMLENQIELVTRAPTYKVGMCMAEMLHEFPRDVLGRDDSTPLASISDDHNTRELIACVMAPDDSHDARPVYEIPSKHRRVDENGSRAGHLLMRRRMRRPKGGGGASMTPVPPE